MDEQLTLVAPMCTCCDEARTLLPRTDLPGGLAVCPQTGTIYRPAGQSYVQATLPALTGAYRPMANVRVDLNQAGYA